MLAYNEDWMHFLWTRYNAGIEVTEEVLKDYIYSFKGTQVTDFMMNLNNTVSTADSAVLETFADKYLATQENGIPVNYKNTFAASAYKLIKEKKIDMYQVWIDTLKEIGINPWISIRMNDCHGNTFETDIRKSSFVDAHPEYHIASHRERTGYFDKCFDFNHREIREQKLKYIDEMLDRYNVYGIEFDWMRDTYFVQFGLEDGAKQVMTDFMNDVFAIVEKYEKKYNHKIKRLFISPSEPNLLIERGMNIFDFIDKLDYITIISRWETSDTNMPIELWKQLLRNTKVQLGGGQQLLYKPYSDYKGVTISVKMAFGEAIANLSRGCDFVYLYNYMDMGNFEGEVSNYIYEDSIRNDINRPRLFGNIGNKETLLQQERSHVVTYSDFCTYDFRKNPKLPIKFDGNGAYQTVKIPVGDLPQNAKLKLILGIDTIEKLTADDITVYVNAEKCEYIHTIKIEPKIYEKECFVFGITPKDLKIMYAEIRILKKCSIDYVEINVAP